MPRKKQDLERGSRREWIPLTVVGLCVAFAFLVVGYVIHPVVRRRLLMRLYAGWLRSRIDKLEGKVATLEKKRDSLLENEAYRWARVFLGKGWRQELEGAPGVGPSTIARLEEVSLPGYPRLTANHLMSIHGIGASRATAIIDHLQRRANTLALIRLDNMRSGEVNPPKRIANARDKLASRRKRIEGRNASLRAVLGDVRGKLASLPTVTFSSFLLSLVRRIFRLRNPRIDRKDTRVVESSVETAASDLGSRSTLQLASVVEASVTRRLVEDVKPAISPSGKPDGTETVSESPPQSFKNAELAGATGMLQLALGVAYADGTIDDSETKKIVERITAAFRLTPEQCDSLQSLTRVPHRQYAALQGESAKWTARIPADKRATVGLFLAKIATADGIVTESERKFLARCFQQLGLPPDLLSQSLPVEVSFQPPARGDRRVWQESLPSASQRPPVPTHHGPTGLSLDRAAISRIKADTHEVALILAQAMVGGDEASEVFEPVSFPVFANDQNANTSDFVGRNNRIAAEPSLEGETASRKEPVQFKTGESPLGRFAAFYADLIVSQVWSRNEAEAVARRYGHMLSGAVEAINDWAYAEFGAPLVQEEGDCLKIDKELMQRSER